MNAIISDCLPNFLTASLPSASSSSPSPSSLSSISVLSSLSPQPSNLPMPSTQVPTARFHSLLHHLCTSFTATVKAILPRRCEEPTGPFVLVCDILLSFFVPRGARRTDIEKLPLHVVAHDLSSDSDDDIPNPSPVSSSDKCPICLALYQNGDTIRQLGCQHLFHTECVDPWLEKKSLCPICKLDPC